MKPILCYLALLAVLLLWVNSQSFADEQAEQANYCEMVKAGYWPDFKNLRGEC